MDFNDNLLYSVHSTVYSLQCTLYSVHFTGYSETQCIVYTLLFKSPSSRAGVARVQEAAWGRHLGPRKVGLVLAPGL